MKHSLAILLAWLLVLAGQPAAASVGFSMLQVPDGAAPPLEVAVWYPTDAPSRLTAVGLLMQDVAPGAPVRGHSLALVVISHGNGGNFASHAATALALARAGFVVAAPTHTGDNNRDQSHATDVAGRTRAIAAVIDHLTSQWSPGTIDPARIGAFGFSTGGFTVLTAAGGVPDLTRTGPHCAANPGLYDCRLLLAARPGATAAPAPAAGAPVLPPSFVRDGRLRALVVAAPALGYTFTPSGLAAVTVPVQLWEAADDVILPPSLYAEPVRAALPRPPEVHVVEHAGHFDFMAPCSEALARAAPAICVSAPGFDRTGFSRRFDAEVGGFFAKTLLP
jgi:predicted dienelactone hydrolase